LFLSVLLIGVSCRSHHGEDHLRPSEEQEFVRRSEALDDSNEEELLQQIDELDTMIKLARNARSIKEDEDPDSMVAEDEMIKVMDSIDLTSTENVEAVSEVLKTLPGEVQLEFLMNKFMMKDAKVKDEIINSKTGSSAKAKRSTYRRGSSHAEPEPEYSYYKQFSTAFSHAEPEPEPRYRRSPDDHDHHDQAPEGKVFTVDTSMKEERGPKSILLQRSADIHGFSEELEASQSQGGSGRSSEKKVVQRLVDMLGKNRKRRSSEDEEEKLSDLPRKQPVAHVDLDF